MDTANDNPIKRFSSFWQGAVIFGIFGLLGLLLSFWFNDPVKTGYDEAHAERRSSIRKEIDEAQSGAGQAAVARFEQVGAALLAAEAKAVEDDRFILPGSDRQLAKAASTGGATGIAVPEDFPRVADDTPVETAMMEAGKTHYNLCLACHGVDGKGTPMVGPPLAGSEWVLGPPENLIAIQLRGLTGPIEVLGKTHTFVAPMPPQFFQTDQQIAEVLTFIRNSFGNKASPVSPEMVKALRGEVGKPMLTQADLVPVK